MHMLNLHKVIQVAKFLGLTVPNIYGTFAWEAMQKSPFNEPDTVKEFFANLPIERFGPYLKVNRLWYHCCKAELWNRHKDIEKMYNVSVEECKKASKILDCLDYFTDNTPEFVAYKKAYRNKFDTFEEQVKVEKALLRCGFISQESWEQWTQMTYNIQVYRDDLTPDCIEGDDDDENPYLGWE